MALKPTTTHVCICHSGLKARVSLVSFLFCILGMMIVSMILIHK